MELDPGTATSRSAELQELTWAKAKCERDPEGSVLELMITGHLRIDRPSTDATMRLGVRP